MEDLEIALVSPVDTRWRKFFQQRIIRHIAYVSALDDDKMESFQSTRSVLDTVERMKEGRRSSPNIKIRSVEVMITPVVTTGLCMLIHCQRSCLLNAKSILIHYILVFLSYDLLEHFYIIRSLTPCCLFPSCIEEISEIKIIMSHLMR